VFRVLSDDDKKRFATIFEPYNKKTSGQYVYNIEHANFDTELEQLSAAYGTLRETVQSTYGQTDIARIFTRVFEEHFTTTNDKILVKPSSELHSSCLQSPDDEDATYRKKRGESYRGNILTATETCNPENAVQLITDVHVTANNRDDSAELNDRLDEIKKKTPEIKTLFTDGGYGSEANDKKMKEMEITQIQTAIRGRESAVEITITKNEDGAYEVCCPFQASIEVHQGKKQWKAVMNSAKCEICPMHESCHSIIQKSCRVIYFDDQDVLKQKRHRNILGLPVVLRKLRANVEATMREFSRKTEGGKLKVRGLFKAALFAQTAAIGINFGRVYRFMQK